MVEVEGRAPGRPDPVGVRFEGVSFGYGRQGTSILSALDFALKPGEFFTLLGPSGCGKTTTLKILAGLIAPDSGRVLIGDRDVTRVPTHRRNIAMVFQNYALFPHMRIRDNVGYGLRRQGLPAAAIAPRVAWALNLVGLPDVGDRYPVALSGGQQQRIGIARALAAEPQVLLLDEPLSNLDAKLREQMCFELGNLHRRLDLTILYVTHDQAEALSMSDRIAVMHKGRIEELGTPETLYARPTTVVAADFLGDTNLIDLTRRADGYRTRGGATLRLAASHDSQTLRVAVRPEAIRLAPPGQTGGENLFHGTVSGRLYRGATTQLRVSVDHLDEPLLVLCLGEAEFALGAAVSLTLPPDDLRIVDQGRPT